MKVYQYIENNGELISEVDAQVDPLESRIQGKDVFLIPKNCTKEIPFKTKEGEINIFNGLKWEIKEDHRGIYYDKYTKEKINFIEFGNVPENLTDKEPPSNNFNYIEWINDDWNISPENEIIIEKQSIKSDLLLSDSTYIHVVDDIISILIDKQILSLLDFPIEVQEKYNYRKELRENLQ